MLPVALAVESAPAAACGKWSGRDFAQAERGLRHFKAEAELVVTGTWTFEPDQSEAGDSGWGTITVPAKAGAAGRVIRAWSEQQFYPNCTNLLRTPQRSSPQDAGVRGRFYLKRNRSSGSLEIFHFEPFERKR